MLKNIPTDIAVDFQTNEAAVLARERDQLGEAFDALHAEEQAVRRERDALRREAALWEERDRQQRSRYEALREVTGNRIESLKNALVEALEWWEAEACDPLKPDQMPEYSAEVYDRCRAVLGQPEEPSCPS